MKPLHLHVSLNVKLDADANSAQVREAAEAALISCLRNLPDALPQEEWVGNDDFGGSWTLDPLDAVAERQQAGRIFELSFTS